jgi:tetrahydromethanopterin S-methyltransferase subunit E
VAEARYSAFAKRKISLLPNLSLTVLEPMAKHAVAAPNGSAATIAPLISEVRSTVAEGVPNSTYMSAPAMHPHAAPNANIDRHAESVSLYSFFSSSLLTAAAEEATK